MPKNNSDLCFYKANPAASRCPTAGGSALVKIEQEQDPPLTYEEFRKRKESCRTSTLKPTASKKAKSVKSNSSDKVKIPIGIKICNEDGLLKVLKGRTLPIAVKPDIDARGLLEEAVNKHTKHFRSFDNRIEYVLLYPDNTVVQNLPGSNTSFSLSTYKEDLGKPYSKMHLFLCSVESLQRLENEEENGVGITPPDCQIVSVVQNSQPIRPFLVPEEVGQSTSAQSTQEITDSQMTCPTCYCKFPLSEIERHADLCVETFDPVGVVNELHELFEDDDWGDFEIDGDGESAVNVSSPIERIKVVISSLQTNVDPEIINKLTVRRKATFQDYLGTRRNPRRHFNPKGVLKVTFIGEPAIDDGGPRREFFSGN